MSMNTPESPTPSQRPKIIITNKNIKLWAYLDITNPLVAWEVAIGRICSADDPSRKIYAASLWFYSLMRRLSKDGLDRRFLNELLLEQARLQTHPDAVSRLRGVYFFESEEIANAAVARWGIPQNRRFISSVNFSANALTQVDSEWITWKLKSEDRDWMPRYWAGETYGERPLTEVLASGIGLIENMELRNEAVRWIYQNWPTSTPLLSMAACAIRESVTLGIAEFETVGLISPVLTVGNGIIQGKHVINTRALATNQAEIIKALEACRARGEYLPWIVDPDNDVLFRVPDLSSFNFEIRDTKAAETLITVHDASISSKS
ncbi:hypothetical protein KVP10_14840 [Candidimonas humi]|uniref:Uncharacterized protein n=1 Tax=Candidimonas humi TaxID=683355 RepID=A0ABV8P141_9BURK|nr:hypothetical protein [Candidimonas humi]MBV6306169.1 hypothetical protein [Candidimonas humi]